MAIPGIITSQTGNRQFNSPNFTNYSGFEGGVNATNKALKEYSPLMNGFGRIFVVRPPLAILKMFAGSDANLYNPNNQFIQFKHMLEYFNRSVTGFGATTLESAATPVQGGYAGRQFQVPTVAKETTTNINISVYEPVGAPVVTTIDGWMNAIGDKNSGFATYGGWISGGTDAEGKAKRLFRRSTESDDGIEFNEAHHTMECIYIMQSRSGGEVERACMLAAMVPTSIEKGILYDKQVGGVHDLVYYDLNFTCVMYEAPIINAIANDLLKQYRIVTNSLNFNPQLGDAVYAPGTTTLFNRALGGIPVDSVSGTNIGNLPAFHATTAPRTVISDPKDITQAQLGGQPGYQAQQSWEGFAPET